MGPRGAFHQEYTGTIQPYVLFYGPLPSAWLAYTFLGHADLLEIGNLRVDTLLIPMYGKCSLIQKAGHYFKNANFLQLISCRW